MSDGRKPKLKEQDADLPRMKVELKEESPLTAEQIYLKRKAEVAQQDNERFSEYLREKAARDEAKTAQPPPTAQPAARQRPGSSKFNRRSVLTWAAGTAVVGEAVTLGYPMLSGQGVPDQGAATPARLIPNPNAIRSTANWSIRRPM